MFWTRALGVSFAAALGLIPPLAAATIVNQTYAGAFPATINGTLANQDTVLEESFTVPQTDNVTIYTTSYASGGFEPNLMLYDSSGNYVATGAIPGTSPLAMPDPTTNNAFDAYLTEDSLAPGTYTVALMDFLLGQSLTATNLSDGFDLNFGSGTTFTDEMGNSRTGGYTLHINLTAASATPEPSTLFLAAPLAALAFLRRRRISQS